MNKKILIIICFLFFLLTLYLSLFKGGIKLGFGDFLDFLFNKKTMNSEIIEYFRFPRMIRAIIAGSALSLAGLYMQGITKNPLAEPYIAGVSSGAGIALTLGVLYGVNSVFLPFVGFFGAIVASLFVVIVAGLNSFSVIKLILVGLSFNIFSSSLISILMLAYPGKTHAMMMILAGSLNNRLSEFNIIIGLFIVAILFCLYITPKMNFLRLDSQISEGLSLKATQYNVVLVLLSSLLASISICAAGILGFVGIIVPHISKMLFGGDYRVLFFVNILLASSFILFSDYIARSILYPIELPLGIVLSVIGAPLFILLICIKGNFAK